MFILLSGLESKIVEDLEFGLNGLDVLVWRSITLIVVLLPVFVAIEFLFSSDFFLKVLYFAIQHQQLISLVLSFIILELLDIILTQD